MRTVIYARYSAGANQTEQSIEGQLRECREYAQTHDMTIVGSYIDRHISGKTIDHRDQFKKMIKDSNKHIFDAVIVWKIDRFARNRYDSAIYKSRLKKNGVRVYYAKEIIPEGPEGIILESLLEGMAEYYSAELSQKIRRGMKESAYKCHATGGFIALGYKIASDKSFEVDKNQAAVVRRIFTMYAEGSSSAEICRVMNSMGLKTAHGAAFNKNSLRTILKNEKYIGVYECLGQRVEGGVPAIVERELFENVQRRIASNRKAPARKKTKINYMLSGKLYCGKCGIGMTGESGTGKHGEKHYYYICVNKKRNKTCDKKTVRKDWLEDFVVDITTKYILQPDRVNSIVKKCLEVQETDDCQNSELALLENQLADTQKSIDNMISAIEQGIVTKSTKNRLNELEKAKEALEFNIDELKIKQPKLSEEQIRFMLLQFQKDGSETDLKYKENIIEYFVNSVYLYDDRIVVAYNLTKEKNELESSFLEFLSDSAKPDLVGIRAGSDLTLFGGGEACTGNLSTTDCECLKHILYQECRLL